MMMNNGNAGGCICSNKDKNFKANHNLNGLPTFLPQVVSVVTKIRILKQITTRPIAIRISNSCICSNKDKNFKANHNSVTLIMMVCRVVSVVTKIRILKQITTLKGEELKVFKLYL